MEGAIPAGRGRALQIVLVVVLLAAAAAIGYYLWLQQQGGAEAYRVRITAPRPSAVYRWFGSTGSVVSGAARALAFETVGRVGEIAPVGTRCAAGEIIGKLQGATAREAEVNQQRARLSYYEQMRDSTRSAGAAAAELGQAEQKVDERKSMLAQAEASLNRLLLRARESGTVTEVLVRPGQLVAANAPAALVKGESLRGQFALDAAEAEKAARLGFCRVEVAGLAPTASNASPRRPGSETSAADSGPEGAAGPRVRSADCRLLSDSGPAAAGKTEVALPDGVGRAPGRPLRLARARYDGVFPVPRSAIVRVGDTERVYVASHGIAEPRAVALANPVAADTPTAAGAGESAEDEALVTQGLDVGDQVIIDPPPTLRDGSPVAITGTR